MLRDGPLPDRHQPHLPYLMPSLEESVPSILISCHLSIYGSSILILRHPSIHGPSILILSHRSIHGPYILISRHLSIDDSSILILGCRSIYGPYILISRCRSLFRDVDRYMAHLSLFWAVDPYFGLSKGRAATGRYFPPGTKRARKEKATTTRASPPLPRSRLPR